MQLVHHLPDPCDAVGKEVELISDVHGVLGGGYNGSEGTNIRIRKPQQRRPLPPGKLCKCCPVVPSTRNGEVERLDPPSQCNRYHLPTITIRKSGVSTAVATTAVVGVGGCGGMMVKWFVPHPDNSPSRGLLSNPCPPVLQRPGRKVSRVGGGGGKALEGGVDYSGYPSAA